MNRPLTENILQTDVSIFMNQCHPDLYPMLSKFTTWGMTVEVAISTIQAIIGKKPGSDDGIHVQVNVAEVYEGMLVCRGEVQAY